MPRAARFAVLICWFASSSAAALAECPSLGPERVDIVAVDERLELHVADGRLLRIVGIEPVGSTPAASDLPDAGRAMLRSLLVGQSTTMMAAAPKPDRWGRLPVFVFTAASGAPLSTGLALLRAGFGRVTTEAAAHPCHDEMLAAETEAREAGRGLWRDPYYAVLKPDDQAAFVEHAATFIVAQGRLTSVMTGPYRTKLIFAGQAPPDRQMSDGSPRPRRLAATLAPRVVKMFGERGMDLHGLVGRDLRMRGLLDLRFGPELLVTNPDAVEILPMAATSAAKRSP